MTKQEFLQRKARYDFIHEMAGAMSDPEKAAEVAHFIETYNAETDAGGVDAYAEEYDGAPLLETRYDDPCAGIYLGFDDPCATLRLFN